MPFGMGLNKNRHGTYEARKKVPAHLEEAVADINGRALEIWEHDRLVAQLPVSPP
jgi:hypothetical protein